MRKLLLKGSVLLAMVLGLVTTVQAQIISKTKSNDKSNSKSKSIYLKKTTKQPIPQIKMKKPSPLLTKQPRSIACQPGCAAPFVYSNQECSHFGRPCYYCRVPEELRERAYCLEGFQVPNPSPVGEVEGDGVKWGAEGFRCRSECQHECVRAAPNRDASSEEAINCFRRNCQADLDFVNELRAENYNVCPEGFSLSRSHDYGYECLFEGYPNPYYRPNYGPVNYCTCGASYLGAGIVPELASGRCDANRD